MDLDAATVFTLCFLGALGVLTAYIIGSVAGTLSRSNLGWLTRIGLGLLGMFFAAGLFVLLGIEPPVWGVWLCAAVIAAGVALIVRSLRRALTPQGPDAER